MYCKGGGRVEEGGSKVLIRNCLFIIHSPFKCYSAEVWVWPVLPPFPYIIVSGLLFIMREICTKLSRRACLIFNGHIYDQNGKTRSFMMEVGSISETKPRHVVLRTRDFGKILN